MSPARLSLSTVASPHCRLLFHLAAGILAEKPRSLGAAQNQASVIVHRGLEVKQQFFASGLGRNISLTFPFIDQAFTQVSDRKNIFHTVKSEIEILVRRAKPA
jgi:hypothetical protein